MIINGMEHIGYKCPICGKELKIETAFVYIGMDRRCGDCIRISSIAKLYESFCVGIFGIKIIK